MRALPEFLRHAELELVVSHLGATRARGPGRLPTHRDVQISKRLQREPPNAPGKPVPHVASTSQHRRLREPSLVGPAVPTVYSSAPVCAALTRRLAMQGVTLSRALEQ